MVPTKGRVVKSSAQLTIAVVPFTSFLHEFPFRLILQF